MKPPDGLGPGSALDDAEAVPELAKSDPDGVGLVGVGALGGGVESSAAAARDGLLNHPVADSV